MIVTCLLITGLGSAGLMGLSVSPVVSIVITSVTGSAAAIIAALSGLEEKSESAKRQQTKVNLSAPDGILVHCRSPTGFVGILVGSMLGIRARNQSWLGSAVAGEITQWTSAGLTGLAGHAEKLPASCLKVVISQAANDHIRQPQLHRAPAP